MAIRFLSRLNAIMSLFGVVLSFSSCIQSPEVRSARHIEAGRHLLQKKDAKRAVIEFRNAVKATPKNADAFYQLGLAYLAAGDVKMGIGSLREAIALNPTHRAARLQLAELMASTSNPDILKDAQQRLQALLQEIHDDPSALHALALTELKLGEPEEAMDHLEEAFSAAPQELSVAVTLAQAKLGERDTKGAEEVLRKVCASSPKSSDALIILGRFYIAVNRPADAAQQFKQALALNPNEGSALLNLAQLQYQAGQKQEAEQSIKRLSGFTDKTFKPVYGIFLFEEGRRDEAIREFERLYKEDPKDRLARTRLVVSYRAANRGADAEALLGRALKENPKDTDALLQRGEMYLAARQYRQAEMDLNQVLHEQPTSPVIHYVLAKLHQARGEALTYRQELSKALDLNPYLVTIRVELAQALITGNGAAAALVVLDKVPQSQKQQIAVLVQRNWALWALGNMSEMRKGIDGGLQQQKTPDLLIQDGLWKLRAGDASGARTALEQALKLDPADLRALLVLRDTYVAQKNGPMALAKVKEYAALQPKSAPVQHFLGELLAAEGKRAEARAAFVAAKTADPNFVNVDLSLVQLDVADRKFEEARKRLQSVVAARSGEAIPNLWLGILQQLNGDGKSAIEQYRKVVDMKPDSAQASNNLAYLLTENDKQLDEALKYAQKAVELNPDVPAYSDTLGWALYKKGLYAPAVRYLSRASSDPRDVVWKYHLAMAYAKSGDRTRAQTTLEAALKSNPNVPEAKMARQVVDQAQ